MEYGLQLLQQQYAQAKTNFSLQNTQK